MLDPYGEGMVTFDDFRLAVEPGEALREMLDEQLHADGNGSASTETGFGFNPWVDLRKDWFCFWSPPKKKGEKKGFFFFGVLFGNLGEIPEEKC